jgi:hypothetical protein
MPLKYAPVSTSLFVVSILGFFISVVYVIQFSETWAVAFAIVFIAMFVSSLISMTHAMPGPQLPGRKPFK